MRLTQARQTVERFVELIGPTCEAVSVAGSIRRGSAEVKDGEIVAIPTAATYTALEDLLKAGLIVKATYGSTGHRWGQKYRGLIYDGLRVELFFATPDNAGYILALRTGPAEANKILMQKMARTSIRCIAGNVYTAPDWARRGKDWVSEQKRQVRVTDEGRWFGLFGFESVPDPQERKADLYDRMRAVPVPVTWLVQDVETVQRGLFDE